MSIRALLHSMVSPLEIPTVYFDTQVFSWVASGRISAQDWKEACDFVRKNAHHCVSLTTLYELLVGVAFGKEESFERYSGCSPYSRSDFFRASCCTLTRFATLGQFFARDYNNLPVR